MKFSALEVDRLQEQIDLLVATNDRSPAAMRTLVYLQAAYRHGTSGGKRSCLPTIPIRSILKRGYRMS